ncbi:MAG: cell division protein FtsI (penicillin-binding protein 3), partial [Arenicella sp.]
YQASFVGYFPADDPKYSLIVNIAGPTKEIYGAQVSGTVFTAIADKVYASSPEYHDDLTESPLIATAPRVMYGNSSDTKLALEKTRVKFQDITQGSQYAVALTAADRVSIQRRNVSRNVVPNVKGMPLNDAVYLLETYKLRVKIEGHGTVVSQSQNPGDELIKGTQIKLVLK